MYFRGKQPICGCPLRLCDRIAFIVSGRTIRTDTVDNLIQPVREEHTLPYLVDLAVLAVFCMGLFAVSLFNIRRRWIA